MRIALPVLAVVLLLSGCVAAPPAPSPTPTATATAAPTPEPQSATPWSTIPLDCSAFFSEEEAQEMTRSADRLIDEMVGNLTYAAARQAGVLDCAWTSPGWRFSEGSGSGVFVNAIAGADAALQESWQNLSTATTYPQGEPSWYRCFLWNGDTVASCDVLTLVGDVWVSGLVNSGGMDADVIGEDQANALAERYIDRVRDVLQDVAEPVAPWVVPAGSLSGDACAATEWAHAAMGSAIQEGADVAGLRHCSIGDANITILPGGAWAVAPALGVQNFKTGVYEAIEIAGFDTVMAGCGGLGCRALAAVDGSAVEVFLNRELASDLDTLAPQLEELLTQVRAAG